MEHGCQPRLSVVYYSTARLSAETTVVYCSILQYSAAASQGYLQYTMVHQQLAEAICSILQTIVQRGCQPRLLQYIVVQHGYQPRLLQYTIVQRGCQPRLSVVYYSTTRLSAEATAVYYNTARLSAEATVGILSGTRGYCSVLQYNTAVSLGYLQYTVVQRGCQPRLSVVYYSTTRLSAETSVVYYSTARLSAEATVVYCGTLQYNTAVSRGYCSTLYSTARLSAKTAVVYYSTARLSAEVTCSILYYNTAVSLSYLQYTVVQHGCQPRLLQYTKVQHGCQPRLPVVYYSTTRLSA